ncbi:MAG: hypothetical protein HUU31_12360 [Anaerolineae bacterium]|nr:hypothetical protein [Anaerolineae bacterium]
MLADYIPAKEGVRGHWDFYICNTKKNSRNHKCPSKRIGARILEQSVIDCLMNTILTRDHLRPLADAIAQQVSQTNTDAGVRLSAVQDELSHVERQVNNLLNAIEEMGLSPSLKEKLTKREAEKERLKSEVSVLERTIISVTEIPHITDAMIDEWIAHIRTALQSTDLEVSRRAIRQFVSKIVVLDGEGEIYYTFPVLPDGTDRRHLGKGEVDLRGRVSYTRHTLDFPISEPLSTTTDERYPDKQQLNELIHALREQGMNYREIGTRLGIHWTRIGQILKRANSDWT